MAINVARLCRPSYLNGFRAGFLLKMELHTVTDDTEFSSVFTLSQMPCGEVVMYGRPWLSIEQRGTFVSQNPDIDFYDSQIIRHTLMVEPETLDIGFEFDLINHEVDEYAWGDCPETMDFDERIKAADIRRLNLDGQVIASGEIFWELSQTQQGLILAEITSLVRADGETELICESELFRGSEDRPSTIWIHSELSEDNQRMYGKGSFQFDK
jgi:hypothetical protein